MPTKVVSERERERERLHVLRQVPDALSPIIQPHGEDMMGEGDRRRAGAISWAGLTDVQEELANRV